MLKFWIGFRKIILMLILFSPAGLVSSQSLKEPSVIALLTLNIVRFTYWPDWFLTQHQDVRLCVVGDSIIQNAFMTLEGSRVGEKSVSVHSMTRFRNFERCQVIFIDKLEPLVLSQILRITQKQLILTVGRGRSFVEAGGIVGIDVVNKKPKLLINISALHQAGLKINARILELAEIFVMPSQSGVSQE
jgi:hypothetical protein